MYLSAQTELRANHLSIFQIILFDSVFCSKNVFDDLKFSKSIFSEKKYVRKFYLAPVLYFRNVILQTGKLRLSLPFRISSFKNIISEVIFSKQKLVM